MEKGQWIFTCSMKPLQFSHIERLNIKKEEFSDHWAKATDEEWEIFANDSFVTLEGSHHSKRNCSCKPISEEYANWFIKNECWNLFPNKHGETKPSLNKNVWDEYGDKIKELCVRDGIKYEGY